MTRIIRLQAGVPIIVNYTNHRGEVALRRILPMGSTWFGSSAWHPKPQWLIDAWDLVKMVERTFALGGITPPPHQVYLCACGWFGVAPKKRALDARETLLVCPTCSDAVEPLP